MYTNNYELGGFLDPSSNWSRYKGPFDIVPVPLPTTDNGNATLQDATVVIYPDTSVAQNIGTGTLGGFLSPTPGTANTDPMLRLTQVYYAGCTMLTQGWTLGQTNYAFMTDCSAGTVGIPRFTKWPKIAPRLGFLIGGGSGTFNDVPSPALSELVTQGEVFYINMNFTLQIEATQNELAVLDDMALYGQINYHPNRGDTTETPYIDWVNSTGPGVGSFPEIVPEVVNAAGVISDPATNGSGIRIYGNPPMNILFKDISTNNFLQSGSKLPFRPQYSGDLLWRGSSINPTTGTIQTPNTIVEKILDPSGAIYNIPIHWRTRCIIPKPSDTGSSYIDWNGVTDASLNPALHPNATIYVSFTMFNTAPEFVLDSRPFNYKIKLDPTNPNPIIGTTLNNAITAGAGSPPGGLTHHYGYSQWQSRSGFSPNFSITKITDL